MSDKLVVPKQCPVCKITSNYIYRLTHDKDSESQWYRCTCGVIHQENLPTHDMYDSKYIGSMVGAKDSQYVWIHAARIYAPLIEELTYGRKLLDVGFGIPNVMKFYEDRGWIVTGIDINSEYSEMNNVINENFEIKEKFDDQYNLIWMSHVLEHFNDPVEVLKKAYDLLPEDGVLYIATPDIDFINKTGVSAYPHWKPKEHYIMWSERALKRELEKIGFKIITCRRNFTARFSSWYDIQLIAQKNYF